MSSAMPPAIARPRAARWKTRPAPASPKASAPIATPLTAAASYLNGARRLLDQEKAENLPVVRDAVDRAAQQALRAGQIIRRLREFVARGEAEPKIESVVKLIEDASALALVGAKETGARVMFNFDPSVELVLADKVQIQQVLLNLIRNAVEAMQESARRDLTISSQRQNSESVIITVADTGSGIPESIRPRIFESFLSGREGGTGLGLAIARRIMKDHHGELTLLSTSPRGTTMRITLPLAV